MDMFAFQAVRLWYIVSREVRAFYRAMCKHASPLETEYDGNWFMLSKTGHFHEVPTPCFDADHAFAVNEVTRTRPDGRTDTRFAILHRDKSRAHYQSPDLFTPVPPPWLMIMEAGEDRTEDLAPYIACGNLVTLGFLQSYWYSETPKEWVYVDPKTFEERQFPSGGILIQ